MAKNINLFLGYFLLLTPGRLESRPAWLAKIDDTTQSIAQALERARTQKQTSAQAVSRRTGEVERSLTEILRAEGAPVELKARIETSLP